MFSTRRKLKAAMSEVQRNEQIGLRGTESEFAKALLGIVQKILGDSPVRRWRLLNQGPRFLKIGAAVRYRREDVDAWLDSVPTGGQRCGGEDK